MKRPFLPLVSLCLALAAGSAHALDAPRAPRHRSHLSADGFEGARRQPEGLRRRSRQRDLPPCAVALPVGRARILRDDSRAAGAQDRRSCRRWRSPKREKQILFSSKLFRFKSRLVARPGSGVDSTTASLAQRIGVQSGTQFESWALAHWAPAGVGVMPYKPGRRVRRSRQRPPRRGVARHRGSRLRLPAHSKQGLRVRRRTARLGDRGVGIGMRQSDTALKASIDGAIASMLKTARPDREKYFDFNPYGD